MIRSELNTLYKTVGFGAIPVNVHEPDEAALPVAGIRKCLGNISAIELAVGLCRSHHLG
jgi:hypothetical protein